MNMSHQKRLFLSLLYTVLSTSLYEWIVLLFTHYCIHLSCNPTVKMDCEPCYVTQHCLRKFDFSKMTFRWKDSTLNRIYYICRAPLNIRLWCPQASKIVPDFTISVYSSSCNYLFFGFDLASLRHDGMPRNR